MKRTRDKVILKKLDEFLAAFDVEELIRDGVDFIKFSYDHPGKKYQESFTIKQFKEEQKNATNNR